MTKQERDEYIETAKPLEKKEFTIEEKTGVFGRKLKKNTYLFESIVAEVNLTEENKGYKATGVVKNIETGKTKKMPLRLIIQAFSDYI